MIFPVLSGLQPSSGRCWVYPQVGAPQPQTRPAFLTLTLCPTWLPAPTCFLSAALTPSSGLLGSCLPIPGVLLGPSTPTLSPYPQGPALSTPPSLDPLLSPGVSGRPLREEASEGRWYWGAVFIPSLWMPAGRLRRRSVNRFKSRPGGPRCD